jgi:hypothetical protein
METENKYNNGKIYRLMCNDGYYYIGSTIVKLNLRFNSHKKSSKIMNTPVYNHINKIGWENVEIELIEEYPCNVKKELNKREDFYIKRSKNDPLCLNINRAYISKDERKEIQKDYYEHHKDEIIESHKEYNEKNRERVDAYHAEYRLKNAEKRREYSRQYRLEHLDEDKERRKKYITENKDKVDEYFKNYRETNKRKISEYKLNWARKKREENKELIEKEREEKRIIREKSKKERISHDRAISQCECGGTYQNYQKKRHELSKKHINFIAANETSKV